VIGDVYMVSRRDHMVSPACFGVRWLRGSEEPGLVHTLHRRERQLPPSRRLPRTRDEPAGRRHVPSRSPWRLVRPGLEARGHLPTYIHETVSTPLRGTRTRIDTATLATERAIAGAPATPSASDTLGA
jgi:hypothetical protein